MCFSCFPRHTGEYDRLGNKLEYMSQRDAEIAMALQIDNENPGFMTKEEALKLGEDFVRNARNLIVRVTTDKGRRGQHVTGDKFRSRGMMVD